MAGGGSAGCTDGVASCGATRKAQSHASSVQVVSEAARNPNVTVVANSTLVIGEKNAIQGRSPMNELVTVFEDDGTTGYFYARDQSGSGNPILDTLHIYNVSDVAGVRRPSLVEIIWSKDGLKSALVINNYVHAVFDFESKRGYCRTGFPPPETEWTRHSHEWDDAVLKLF